MTNEAETKANEEYAQKLRAARIRGAVAFAGTLLVAVLVYRCTTTTGGDLPVTSCKTDGDCAATRTDDRCLNAPTGSYCSHACNAAEECASGFICRAPPWIQGKTETLCIHDSQHIGQP